MKAIRQIIQAGLLISLLFILVCCSSIPRYPISGELHGESLRTSVDSEIARYYFEHYLQDKRNNPIFDKKIDRLYKRQRNAQPNRQELKEISGDFSVDFAALFLADRLWSIEGNKKLQNTFNEFLEEKEGVPYSPPAHYPSYLVLFVPGWDYVEHGHMTGADFAAPRELVTNLGIENHLVEISSHGSVEENAQYLSNEIIQYSQSGKNIIIAGASSAGPAIHLCVGELLNKEQLHSVKAWINLGGILQGSPLIDYLGEWPRGSFLNIYMWYRGWHEDELTSMAVEPSRERFKRLSIPTDLLIINYLGVPLSGQLSEYAQDNYQLFAPEGPNDGLTLLTDAIAPNSMTIVALGRDHFLAEDPRINDKTVALTKTVISYLEQSSDRFHLYQ